jgi:excisionase family DNA binding protein
MPADYDEEEQEDLTTEQTASVPRPPDEGLTVVEAAAALGLSPTEVRRLIRTGRLPAQRYSGLLGAEYRIEEAAVTMLRGREDALSEGLAAGEEQGDAVADGAAAGLAGAADAELAALRQEVAALHTEVAALRQEIAALHTEVAALRQEIATQASRAAEREAALRAETRALLQDRETARAGVPGAAQNRPANPLRALWRALRRS